MSGDERARVIAEVLAAHRLRADGNCECGQKITRSGPWLPAFALPTPAPEAAEGPAEVKWCGFCDVAGHTTDECTVRMVRARPAPASEDATLTADRDALGRLVREVWVEWAREQESPKSSWLVDWEGLSEPDREVDRRIGERLYAEGAQRGAADRATLAAVRALADDLTDFDCVDDESLVPRGVDVPDDYELGINEAGLRLRALLDGPDAGGGRRE